MEKTGIKSRQRLEQYLTDYELKRKNKTYHYPPLLIEGEDYEKVNTIFFESALEKLSKVRQT